MNGMEKVAAGKRFVMYHLYRFHLISFFTLLAVAGTIGARPVLAQQTGVPVTLSPAQTEEMARLRPLIGAQAAAKIDLASAPNLAARFPLKVFVSVGLDGKVRDNFSEWVRQWQKKEAKKHGSLELVAAAENADVILVRYTLIDRPTQEWHNKSVPTLRNTTSERQDRIAGTEAHTTSSTYKVENKTVSVTVVPAYAYIVARKNGDFEILSRAESLATVGEEKNTGKPLWEALKTLLKNRPPADKPQR